MKLRNATGTNYRQGDVMVVAHGALPGGTRPIETAGKLVLAEGEVTGHAHTISAPPTRLRVLEVAELERDLHLAEGTRFFEALDALELVHQEHATHTLPRGIFEIRHQVEWSDEKEPRRVAD